MTFLFLSDLKEERFPICMFVMLSLTVDAILTRNIPLRFYCIQTFFEMCIIKNKYEVNVDKVVVLIGFAD